VEYARRLSLGLDLWILMRTVPTVLFAKGSY
jgi:lipopolysaccharide/colanic/teichoic acid biosynthesis glycosyltransferase